LGRDTRQRVVGLRSSRRAGGRGCWRWQPVHELQLLGPLTWPGKP
jgi:hypothetical protein